MTTVGCIDQLVEQNAYFLCMQKSLEEKQVASGRGIPLFIGVIEACLFGGTSREKGREEVGFQAPKF